MLRNAASLDPKLTKLELQVMETLWSQPTASIR